LIGTVAIPGIEPPFAITLSEAVAKNVTTNLLDRHIKVLLR